MSSSAAWLVTMLCCHLVSEHIIQNAPVIDNSVQEMMTTLSHFDASFGSQTNATTSTPTSDHRTESVNSTTDLSPSTEPSTLASVRATPNRRSQFRLKQSIPVDLLNPCKMEDENWSESYFHYQADEKYEHDSEEDWEPNLADSLLNDHLNHTEDQNRLRVTLTQLVGKAKFGYDLLLEMIHKANHLQGLVTDMIRNHLIKECRHLELPDIMEIPKYNSLESSSLVTVLGAIYQTLANQTAHHYFIWQEQRKQSNRLNVCSQHGQPIHTADSVDTRQAEAGGKSPANVTSTTAKPLAAFFNKRAHARRVADDFLVVSSNLRGLMCDFKKAFHLFDIPVPTRAIVQQVLGHTFVGSMACARMSVVDCQLMQTSVRIFADIEEFLRNQSNIIQFFGNHHTGKRPRIN